MKKYWEDPYKFSFETRIGDVVQEGDRLGVVLEETYFFPEGGGQPSDRGKIAGASVVDVQEVGDVIVHFVEGDDRFRESLREGTVVSCEIDADYRLHNMRTHSACHLLFGAARKLFPEVSYAGFHIGEVGSLYLEIGRSIRGHEVREIERLANEGVIEDRPVTTYQVGADRAAHIEGLAYNIDLPEGEVRIVDMHDWDTAACSGTHVQRTIEVGPIKVLGRDIHSKNVTRIDYAVGERAVAEMARDVQVLGEVTESLNTSRDQLSQVVQKMASDLQEAEKTARKLRQTLAEYRGQELLQGGEMVGQARLLVAVAEQLDAGQVRKMVAKAISGEESIVMALIAGHDDLTVTAGRSNDVDVDLTGPVVTIARQRGGGGGGRPNFVSAGGIAGSAEEVRDQLKVALEEALRGS